MPASLLLVSALLSHSAPLAAAGYAVTQRFPIGGSGGWDYLTIDARSQRLYIARDDRVLVVNTATGKVMATVPGMDGAHGVALAPNWDKGFVSNGRSGSVTEFSLKTLQPVREIPVKGENPDALVYDPRTRRLFVFNGRSHDASVLDIHSAKVLGKIPLPGKPEFTVVNDNGVVFVNIEDTAQLVRIHTAPAKVTAQWHLEDCSEPTGLALDMRRHRLFSVCRNGRMAVTDALDGHHVASVPIGTGPDGVAFDVERGLVFSANGGDGTLTVVRQDDADHYHVVANVPTQASARTLALDPKTHGVYTVAAQFAPAPAPTAQDPHPRRSVIDGSFTLLSIGDVTPSSPSR